MQLSRLDQDDSSFQFGTFVSLSAQLPGGSVRRAQTSHRPQNGQKSADSTDRCEAMKIIDNEPFDEKKPDHSNTVADFAESSNKWISASGENPQNHACAH
jgi:hypothetical protein